MTRVNRAELFKQLQAVARSRTAKADVQFDEDGRAVKAGEDDEIAADNNVLVIESNAPGRHE